MCPQGLDESHRVASGRWLSRVKQRLPRVAADTEEFGHHPLASAAGDTALSIANLAEFLCTHDVDQIVDAPALARDTVDIFLQIVYAPHPFHLDSEIINEHPLMQRERRRQD